LDEKGLAAKGLAAKVGASALTPGRLIKHLAFVEDLILRPKLAVPLGVRLSSQLASCADGRVGWRSAGLDRRSGISRLRGLPLGGEKR
jgi:hypothetical protein